MSLHRPALVEPQRRAKADTKNFVVYGFSNWDESKFRHAFDNAFGGYSASTRFLIAPTRLPESVYPNPT